MPATQRATELAIVAARAASDLKAEEIIALDVSEQLVLTDVFLIASANNERQVVAISFNESGTVTNVERFGLERGQIVVLSRRVLLAVAGGQRAPQPAHLLPGARACSNPVL